MHRPAPGHAPAHLAGFLEAKKKQFHTVKPEDVGVDVKPRLKTLKVSEPASQRPA